jgi:hypothetical protein
LYDWLLRCRPAHLDAITVKLELDDAFLPGANEPLATRAGEIWKLVKLRGAKGVADLGKALKEVGVPEPDPKKPQPSNGKKLVKSRSTPVSSRSKAVPVSTAQPTKDASPVAPGPATQPRTIRIFLASSEELREDRDAFELYFRQQNDQFRKKGLYLEITRWENFLDAMSETRLQDEYNQAVRYCDVFVSLFFTKTGKFTEEEFDTAHRQFRETGKPLIYTFFKNAPINTGSARADDLRALWAFQNKLKALGHFYTGYDSVEHLKRQFRDQLDKMLGP